jgi:hypothetical protein
MMTRQPSANEIGGISEIRFQHLTAHLRPLGPRSTFELLKEVVGGADVIERTVEVTVEADDPRPCGAVTLRRGLFVLRFAYISLLSAAKREAARRGWRRAA